MIRVENYKKGDEIEILKLFNKVFNKELSKEYWEWRFKNNLTNQTLIKLAWEEQKLVSHYAACPIPMKHQTETFNAALSMTTMTDPDYNGMGLFPRLANELFDEMPEQNIKLVYGFPNRNSHYSFIKKLNWENICSIFQFSFGNWANIKGKYEVKQISHISDDHLINSSLDNFDLQINRNLDFYNWRYNLNPVNKYSINEIEKDNIKHFIVYKCFIFNNIRHIDILEISIDDDLDLLSSFLNYIYQSNNLNENSMINIWLSVFNRKFSLFEKLGFLPKEPITYLGYKSFNFINNLTEQKVHFTMGDSDVY